MSDQLQKGVDGDILGSMYVVNVSVDEKSQIVEICIKYRIKSVPLTLKKTAVASITVIHISVLSYSIGNFPFTYYTIRGLKFLTFHKNNSRRQNASAKILFEKIENGVDITCCKLLEAVGHNLQLG